MPFSLRKLSKLNLIALLVVAMIGMATFGFGFRDWFSRPTPTTITQQLKPEATADVSVPLVQELLTLRPTGFDPAELTIPSGNFQLAVDNLTGISSISLTLTEERKDKLKVHTDYDDSYPYNNPKDVWEYDYGTGAPGALLRRTHTEYAYIVNGLNYATDTNIHLRGLPSLMQVFDAGGNKKSETSD